MDYLIYGLLMVLEFVVIGTGVMAGYVAIGCAIMYGNPLYMLLLLVTAVCIVASRAIDEMI